ncbi:hypothetical protein [Rhizobium sp. SYY.PMSO]|uniref:hypothetical protein n=1 Tax=Rhizobium sp. SYY.PMSO TaxID=3382192 RepID=UPI000DE1D9BF
MKTMFYFAQADIFIDTMYSDGPGDEDVNTKSGRQTRVKVKTATPAPAANAQEIQVYVDYSVEEVHKDYTHLSGRAVARIQLESGLTFSKFGAGFKDASYSETIGGQKHNWIDISSANGIVGSVLQWCSVKIDGKGDDANGNTQLRGHLSVPLWVNVEESNPANRGEVSTASTSLPLTITEALSSHHPATRALAESSSGKGVVKIVVSQAPSVSAKTKHPA